MMKILFVAVISICLSGGVFARAGSVKGYSLITDLGDTSATVRSVRMLFEKLDVYSVSGTDRNKVLENKGGLVILLAEGSNVTPLKKLTDQYVTSGGTAVMDIRAFAALNGYKTNTIATGNILVTKESSVTQSYKEGEPVRYSGGGKLVGLAEVKEVDGVTVLGKSDNGDIVLVEQEKGKGKIVAVDMVSLQEPKYGVNTENKYLFLVNAIGNRVKYGKYYPKKYPYSGFVKLMEDLAEQYPSVRFQEEGDATGEYKIYSLNMGNPDNPGILIYSCTHGNEWENCYGALTFMKYLAENPDQDVIDLNTHSLKIIPILNPFGYENMTRQNGNKVDLNRNGACAWNEYQGEEPEKFRPGAYDWKGTSSFSEPESQTLRKVVETGNFIVLLDVHGNPSGTGYNKWMGVAKGSRSDAPEKGEEFKEAFNSSIGGRYILHQKHEELPKEFVIETIMRKAATPNLYNSLSDNRYGYIVEILCGYSSTYFIVMQSDMMCELCAAFCRTFAR